MALAPVAKSLILLYARVGSLMTIARKVRHNHSFAFQDNRRAVLKRVNGTENIKTRIARWWHVIALAKVTGSVRPEMLEYCENKVADLRAQIMETSAENRMTEEQQVRYRTLDGLDGILNASLSALYQEYELGELHVLNNSELTTLNRMRTGKWTIVKFAKQLQRIALMPACSSS